MFACPKVTFTAASAMEMYGKNCDQPHTDDPAQSPEPRIRKIKWNLYEQLLNPTLKNFDSFRFLSSHSFSRTSLRLSRLAGAARHVTYDFVDHFPVLVCKISINAIHHEWLYVN